MKKSLQLYPLYIGTFTVAFAGFFFLKLDSANNTPSGLTHQSGESMKPALASDHLPSTGSDGHSEITAGISQEKFESDADMINKKAASKSIIGKSVNTKNYQQKNDAPKNTTGTKSSLYTAEYNYENNDTYSRNINNTVMSSSYSYNDYSSDALANNSTAESDKTDTFSIPAAVTVTVDDFPETRSDNTIQVASDGSEFLPDGKSQEDLIKSLSKNPLVYTIKDYQQASISCDNSYGAPSAHAELMHKLKGC